LGRSALVGLVVTWNAGPELGPRWYPLSIVVTAGGVLKLVENSVSGTTRSLSHGHAQGDEPRRSHRTDPPTKAPRCDRCRHQAAAERIIASLRAAEFGEVQTEFMDVAPVVAACVLGRIQLPA
jgi:hypothetical protein